MSAVAGNLKRRIPPSAPGAVAAEPKQKSGQPQVNGQQQQQQQASYDMLQMKYLTVDRNYETLKQLTRKGITVCGSSL